MAAVGRRISRAYTSSRRYLAANVHPAPGAET
jgi:NTE family protein